MSQSEQRALLVPDGLAGERVDVGLARLFGFSRTKAADLVSQGLVLVAGQQAMKSDRLEPGVLLEVSIPEQVDLLVVRPELVEGIAVIYEDDDIIVIDKPQTGFHIPIFISIAVMISPLRISNIDPLFSQTFSDRNILSNICSIKEKHHMVMESSATTMF